MVVIECSVPNCTLKTNDVSEALAIALITNHDLAHRPSAPLNTDANPALTTSRGPKLERLKIDIAVTIEEWNVFTRRWGPDRLRDRRRLGTLPAIAVRRTWPWGQVAQGQSQRGHWNSTPPTRCHALPNSNSSCPLRATHRASPAKARARLSNRASCTCFRSPCEKIIASLWRGNSSRDLKTELYMRVWELCCRSELWSWSSV